MLAQVKDWENKYKNQEHLRKKEQRTHSNNSEYFYQRCLMLEHKIIEIERFLADYGLVWVGDTKNSTGADNINNNYIDTSYSQLVANIDQLNLTAGKGEVHVHHNEKGGGATFKVTLCSLPTLASVFQRRALKIRRNITKMSAKLHTKF
ncbi:PREDICTED: uncharacterized protein LOC106744800 [Dinoponera quadriceps]|uniref:Uncharacterized protein LOC106744800 n=1 Tax=Dinoponera quadriceps TaxID=609295 RepID=A0A6P3XBP8_DINQU|nr:PREDICTED: uncharacterized protein LOC106744800 [Dinoponera quadriceps]